jgi:hypothetical protein
MAERHGWAVDRASYTAKMARYGNHNFHCLQRRRRSIADERSSAADKVGSNWGDKEGSLEDCEINVQVQPNMEARGTDLKKNPRPQHPHRQWTAEVGRGGRPVTAGEIRFPNHISRYKREGQSKFLYRELVPNTIVHIAMSLSEKYGSSGVQ